MMHGLVEGLPTDLELALFELSKDPLFPELSDEQKEFYTTEACLLGDQIYNQYVGPYEPIDQLLDKWECHVEIARHPNVQDGILRNSDYFPEKNLIRVYQEAIEEIEYLVRMDSRLDLWRFVAIPDVLIAREFFHHLEAVVVGNVEEHFPSMEKSVLYFFSKKHRVQQVRVIAANQFAKSLLRLPNLPSILDWYRRR
ncbi:hypothetical protein [Risungbinella massiliensis]|uniref:hypothetical protein n=1 Tax=Risungbinella massiliensis TaxID=1329796 RepID=UPI0005CBF9B0|nr:hypothetical protein [Risungbinella massiliensis]